MSTRIAPPSRPHIFARIILWLARRRYGRAMRPLQVAAHVPGFLVPYMMTHRFVGDGTLLADLRLLAMQLTGEINGCAWCIDFGRSLASAESREKMFRIREYATDPAFSPAERAALRYAEEATRVPVEVADETFAELRRHFSERQIVELTFAIATESFYNRINAPLEVEAEGFCAVEVIAAGEGRRGLTQIQKSRG